MKSLFFFFNDTATTEIYTLSLHDALPILPSALPERIIVLARSVVFWTGTEDNAERDCMARLRWSDFQSRIQLRAWPRWRRTLALQRGRIKRRGEQEGHQILQLVGGKRLLQAFRH